MALEMATTICPTPPQRAGVSRFCAAFRSGSCSSRQLLQLSVLHITGMVRPELLASEPAIQTACWWIGRWLSSQRRHSSYRFCTAWQALAYPSKWARRCEEKGKVMADTHGESLSHWRTRLRGRAARRGRRWGTAQLLRRCCSSAGVWLRRSVTACPDADSLSVARGEAASGLTKEKGRVEVPQRDGSTN